MNADINPVIGAMLNDARAYLLDNHPLFKALDLKPLLIGKGKATFSIYLPDDFTDAKGDIHGGLLTIIMDSIFGLSVFTALEEVKPIATINLRTDYLQSVAPGGRVACAAECRRRRGDIAYVTGDVTDEKTGAVLASGAGAFMIGTRGADKGSRP